MNIIFLDIDGVLNRDGTKERCCGFVGVDRELADLFTSWLSRLNDTHLVLSSTWRKHEEMWPCLRSAGIRWITATPILGRSRGIEIDAFLSSTSLRIDCYAILDDDSDMLQKQTPFFVQTNPSVGVTESNLIHLQDILTGATLTR